LPHGLWTGSRGFGPGFVGSGTIMPAPTSRPAVGSRHYGDSAEMFGSDTAPNARTTSSSLSASVRMTLFHPVPGGPNSSNGVAGDCWLFFRSV
jgi:hypothetical protein